MSLPELKFSPFFFPKMDWEQVDLCKFFRSYDCHCMLIRLYIISSKESDKFSGIQNEKARVFAINFVPKNAKLFASSAKFLSEIIN